MDPKHFPPGSEAELTSPLSPGLLSLPYSLSQLEIPTCPKKSSLISHSPTHSPLHPTDHPNLLIPHPKLLLTPVPFWPLPWFGLVPCPSWMRQPLPNRVSFPRILDFSIQRVLLKHKSDSLSSAQNVSVVFNNPGTKRKLHSRKYKALCKLTWLTSAAVLLASHVRTCWPVTWKHPWECLHSSAWSVLQAPLPSWFLSSFQVEPNISTTWSNSWGWSSRDKI